LLQEDGAFFDQLAQRHGAALAEAAG
jgi:hypothetical protein